MKPQPLKDKLKYTASIFKDVEFNYGVNFVGKKLYNSIGRNDKIYGMKLFLKEDIRSAVKWLKLKRAKRYCPRREEEVFMVDWADILKAFEDVVK